jgi:transposase
VFHTNKINREFSVKNGTNLQNEGKSEKMNKIHAIGGNNNEPVIPGRRNRKEAIVYDQEKYKKRGLIERIFGKLKENRRLTVRYEKSDINFLGFILVAFLKILLC